MGSMFNIRNRVHDGAINLALHGLIGDGRDSSDKLQDAVAAALDRGWSKIIAPGGQTYRVTDLAITEDFEIDMNGSTLRADFNGAVTGGPANIFHNLPDGADVSRFGLRTGKVDGAAYIEPRKVRFKLSNAILHGGYDPAVPLSERDEQPLVVIYGGEVEFDNVTLTEAANYSVRALLTTVGMDYRNQGVLVQDADYVAMRRCRDVSNACEAWVIQSTDQRTILKLEDFYADRERSYDDGVYHTLSTLLCYNLNRATVLDGIRIGTTRKSGINFMSSGTIRNFYQKACTESSAIDLNEAGYVNGGDVLIDGFRVDMSARAAIRGTGSNIDIRNGEVSNCRFPVLLEGNIEETDTLFPELPKEDREMFNVSVSRIKSNGHDDGGIATNALVRAVGASSGKPIHLTIDGLSSGGTADFSAVRTEYGVDCENVSLTARGLLKEGSVSVIRMTGYAAFKGEGFKPLTEPGQGANVLNMNGAAVDGPVIFEDCERQGGLDAGAFDILTSGGTNVFPVHLNNSPTIDGLGDVVGHPIYRNGSAQKEVVINTAFSARQSVRSDHAFTGVTLDDNVSAQVLGDNLLVDAIARVVTAGNVEVTIQNMTDSTVGAADYTVRILVQPKGYVRA